jgi:hypothetical protein
MTEHEIASVLRKLSPSGEVSHEEALGGQAIRENAADYSASIADYLRLARGGRRREADSTLARARDVLRDLQAVRENYRMMDDEFQLPVLAARYLGDPAVTPDRKRAFLSDTSSHGATHLALLLRELGYVATLTAPYAGSPTVEHLVAFPSKTPRTGCQGAGATAMPVTRMDDSRWTSTPSGRRTRSSRWRRFWQRCGR